MTQPPFPPQQPSPYGPAGQGGAPPQAAPAPRTAAPQATSGGTGYPQSTYPSGDSGIGGGYASGPAPTTPSTPRKSRAGIWVALGCLVLLVGGLVLGGGGVGIWLLTREDTTTTTSAPPSDPEEERVTQGDEDSVSVLVVDTGSFDSLEIDGETYYPASGSFVGVSLDLTNHNTTDIGLDGEAFQMVGDDGSTYPIYYGSFSTSGPWIAPGETAEADLYADIPAGVSIEAVTYTDAVATGGEPAEIPLD